MGNQGTKIDTTPLLNEAVAEPAQAVERGEGDMSDLPQWAKGDEEGGGNTDLEDKLVDEAKHDEPESSTVEVEADEVPGRIDSGSRVLFFFRFVAALTVIMALVLIATNCYIIYKSYDDLQGDELHKRFASTTSIQAVSTFQTDHRVLCISFKALFSFHCSTFCFHNFAIHHCVLGIIVI